jgi:hypothetical protein
VREVRCAGLREGFIGDTLVTGQGHASAHKAGPMPVMCAWFPRHDLSRCRRGQKQGPCWDSRCAAHQARAVCRKAVWTTYHTLLCGNALPHSQMKMSRQVVGYCLWGRVTCCGPHRHLSIPWAGEPAAVEVQTTNSLPCVAWLVCATWCLLYHGACC